MLNPTKSSKVFTTPVLSLIKMVDDKLRGERAAAFFSALWNEEYARG